MSTFKNWTDLEVAWHNAKVAKGESANSEPGTAPAPNPEPGTRNPERELHEQIIAECKRRGWYYVHSRMDRATTTALGVPDFIIAAGGGRTFWIEAKTRTGKPTTEQLGVQHWLTRLGHQAAVVRNLEEFQKVMDPHKPVAATGSALAILADLIEDPHDNGDYRLNISGDDLAGLWRAIERGEAPNNEVTDGHGRRSVQ